MKLTFIVLLLGAVNTQALKISPANADLNIYALPVGQGDSTIIQCPSQYGGYITVVDSGSCKSTNYMTAQDVVNFLNGQTIEKIFLSHPDKDHINYIDTILQGRNPYPPIYYSCPWNANTYGKYIKTPGLTLNQIGGPSCCGMYACPQYIICQNNVRVNVLASGLGGCTGNKNGDSLFLQVEYSGKTVYLPGDFEGNQGFIQNFINCAGSLQSDIYRLAHHGAYNGQANTAPVLDRIQPVYAFSSSGLKNNYVHPRCEVYDHLKLYDPRLIRNTVPHYYTCNYNRQWQNLTISEGVYVTTVIDPTTPTAYNYVLLFSFNTVNILEPRFSLFNSFPVPGLYTPQSDFKYFLEDDDDCGDTNVTYTKV